MKQNAIIPLLITGLSLFTTVALSTAATLSSYSFSGSPPSLAPTTTAPGVTASDVAFSGSATAFNSIPDIIGMNAASGAIDAATAVTKNSYMEFSLTPVSGQVMALTSLSFDAASGTDPRTVGYAVRSSLDNYASNLQSGNMVTQYSTLSPFSVDLSSAAFQGLTASVSFRLYSWTTANNPAAAYDNLSISGTVPEPSAGVLGLLTTGLLLRRRRRPARI